MKHRHRPYPVDRGKEGNEAGKRNERRFLDGCEDQKSLGKFPEWLFFFEKATQEEDQEGIDAWAHTDVGKISLQIKSSSISRGQFLARKNREHIICIVVAQSTPFKTIFAFTLSQLTQRRLRLLAQK